MTTYRSVPKSFRLHIGIFGRRNAGKSALLNMLTRQQVSIVSEVAGTTTDPVEKPMEMLPLGPVLFIDTAGVDDEGALGEMRVQKTRQVLDRADLALLVCEAGRWETFEDQLLAEFRQRKLPVIVVFNKVDVGQPDATLLQRFDREKIPWVLTAAAKQQGLDAVREALIRIAPEDFINSPPLIADLIAPGDIVVLVVPIDKEAPKGRLIQPQVLTLREILDCGAIGIVVRDTELAKVFPTIEQRPALVVTDSQVFRYVAQVTPSGVKMTSFSILMARQKGDLKEFVRGAMAIESLRAGDHVLVAEACSHHPIGDDIGRVKIPRWLQEYVGGPLHFTTVQGHDFPENLGQYKLVIHCGACMWNRREVLTRIERCRQAKVPITNYGVTIAYTSGILDRALEPFSVATAACR